MADPPAGFGHYYCSQEGVDTMVMVRPGTNARHEAEMKALMVQAEIHRKATWWPNRFKGLTLLGMAYGSACTGPLIASLGFDGAPAVSLLAYMAALLLGIYGIAFLFFL